MKRFLISSVAALGLLAAAGSAFAAPAVGTITITGTVTNKCSVATFADSKDLGEMADAAGHLTTALASATAAFTSSFNLTCTSANAGVSVLASPLNNTTVATAPAGYARQINYTGRAAIDLVNTGGSLTTNYDDLSSAAGATTSTFGASNFLANSLNNVRVSAFSFNTANTATDLLVAGAYSGTIVVTITP